IFTGSSSSLKTSSLILRLFLSFRQIDEHQSIPSRTKAGPEGPARGRQTSVPLNPPSPRVATALGFSLDVFAPGGWRERTLGVLAIGTHLAPRLDTDRHQAAFCPLPDLGPQAGRRRLRMERTRLYSACRQQDQEGGENGNRAQSSKHKHLLSGDPWPH